MFKYRFDAVLKLREEERNAARAMIAEANEALRQIEERRQQLADERSQLTLSSTVRRSGPLSMDRLLADGRYDRQLAADDTQMLAAKEKIEIELERRQQALVIANVAVRQIEILRDKDVALWVAAQEKIAQSNLDEIAARRTRTSTIAGRSSLASVYFDDNDFQEGPEA